MTKLKGAFNMRNYYINQKTLIQIFIMIIVFMLFLHFFSSIALSETVSKDPSAKNDYSVTSTAFEKLYPKANDKGLYGYVDNDGNYKIEPQYEAANPFLEDGTTFVNRDGNFVRIDTTGKIVYSPMPGVNFVKSYLSNGFAIASSNSFDNYHYGVINEKGHWITRTIFFEIGDFDSDGIAIVIYEDPIEETFNYGIINKLGEWVIKPVLTYLLDFNSKKLASAQIKGGLAGVINKKGEWVIEPKFSLLLSFNKNGVAAAKDENNVIGAINEKGEWLFKIKTISKIRDFNDNGMAIVMNEDAKYGVINEKGETMADYIYLDISDFNKNGFAIIVDEKHHYGLMDDMGKIAVKPSFLSLNDAHNGLYIASPDKLKYGIINENGDYIADPIYSDILLAKDGEIFWASIDSVLYGLLEKNGKWITEPKFDDFWIKQYENGFIAASVNKVFGLLNEKGEWVVKPQFEFMINYVWGDDIIIAYDGNLKKNMLYNFLGELVLEPIYAEIVPFSEDLVIAKKDSDSLDYVYLNKNGERRVPICYFSNLERN
jgi:hypothetical protein